MEKNVVLSLVLLLGLSLLGSGCGSHSYYDDYSSSSIKVKSISVSPSNLIIKAGDSAAITVTGTCTDNSTVTVNDYSVSYSKNVGTFDDNSFQAKYPGKSLVKFTSCSYLYSGDYTTTSNSSNSATAQSSTYYLYSNINVEVLPKESRVPLPPIVTITKRYDDLLCRAIQNENIEGIEISYGTDSQATNKGTLVNKISSAEGYIWSYQTSSGNCYDFVFNYSYGPQCLSTRETYYYKIRGINCYGAGEWSEVKILSESAPTSQPINNNNNTVNNQTREAINQVLTREAN